MNRIPLVRAAQLAPLLFWNRLYYTTPEELLASLPERVIAHAEAKVAETQRERASALLRSRLSRPPLQDS